MVPVAAHDRRSGPMLQRAAGASGSRAHARSVARRPSRIRQPRNGVIAVMNLNIGCGRTRPLEGAVNLDISSSVGADVVHDLNKMPWPFGDDTFDEVHANDVVEHLNDVVRSLDEESTASRDMALIRTCRRAPLLKRQHFYRRDASARFRLAQPRSAPSDVDAAPVGTLQSRDVFRRISGRILFHPSLLNKSGTPLRQPLARCLRATVGLDISRVVHFAPAGGY